MTALKYSSLLDSKLQVLFSNSKIVKIGMAFNGDLDMLRKTHSKFQAFRNPINSYADLLTAYKAAFSNESPGGLAGICKALLGKPLCKERRMSNWDRRPLSLSQLHYAALDSYVQLKLWQELNRLLQNCSHSSLLTTLGANKGTNCGKNVSVYNGDEVSK